MYLMKIKYIVLVFLLSLFIIGSATAQKIQPGFEVQEFAKIADFYQHIPSLQFTMHFIYEQCDQKEGEDDENDKDALHFKNDHANNVSGSQVPDSSNISFFLMSGKMFMTNDEVEALSGDEHYIYVDKKDSVISINNRLPQTIIQLPLMDSLFRSAHVLKMKVVDFSDSSRIIKVIFQPGSWYRKYEIEYNPMTMVVNKVRYYTKGTGDGEDDKLARVTIIADGYTYDIPDPSVFNEARYIYKLNDKIYLQPAWQQFQLQN